MQSMFVIEYVINALNKGYWMYKSIQSMLVI